MSVVIHSDNESCRPQSISQYRTATVVTSVASHTEAKTCYHLDVTKQGWLISLCPRAKTSQKKDCFTFVTKILKLCKTLFFGVELHFKRLVLSSS